MERAYTSKLDFAVLMVAAIVFAAIGASGVAEYWDRPFLAIPIGLWFGTFAALLLRAAIRVGVYTDATGLTLNGFVRTQRLRWEQIERFDYKRVAVWGDSFTGTPLRPVPVAELHDGGRVKLPVPRFSDAVGPLNEQLSEWRRATGWRPPPTAA